MKSFDAGQLIEGRAWPQSAIPFDGFEEMLVDTVDGLLHSSLGIDCFLKIAGRLVELQGRLKLGTQSLREPGIKMPVVFSKGV